MQIKDLRALLDAISKHSDEGENTQVFMLSDNSHGSGSWEYANVENVVQFADDSSYYLAADFNYMSEDPYDSKVKTKYTDVREALKDNWTTEESSQYCDDEDDDDKLEGV